MEKYNTDPLVATGKYFSLFWLISFFFSSASLIFLVLSSACVLELFNTTTISSLSKRFPSLFKLSKISFWHCNNEFLFLVISAKICFKVSSKGFCSLEMTIACNCCSKPIAVTQKSIMVVFAANSGVK